MNTPPVVRHDSDIVLEGIDDVVGGMLKTSPAGATAVEPLDGIPIGMQELNGLRVFIENGTPI